MEQNKKQEIANLSNADNKKWLRISKKDEEQALKKHTNDIYKRISVLKIKKEQMDFNTFDGDYSQFVSIQRRLDLKILEEEDKLKYSEDMQDLYDKEIPYDADMYNTSNKEVYKDRNFGIMEMPTTSTYSICYDKSQY